MQKSQHNFILVILKKWKHAKVFSFWSRILSFCIDLYYLRPIFIFNYKSSINLNIDGVVFDHMLFKTFVVWDAHLVDFFKLESFSFGVCSQKTGYCQGSMDSVPMLTRNCSRIFVTAGYKTTYLLSMLKMCPIFVCSLHNFGKSLISGQSCTLVWMADLKFKSWTDSNRHAATYNIPSLQSPWCTQKLLYRCEYRIYITLALPHCIGIHHLLHTIFLCQNCFFHLGDIDGD